MATYSHTISYNINVPEPDTTMTTSMSLTCTSVELEQVNDYLARASSVLAKRGPYVGEFKGLRDIKGRSLSFTSTTGRIEVRNHPLDLTSNITCLISCICAAVPGLGIEGKIYQVNAYFGKRIIYDVTKRPRSKNIDVVQHWDAVRPGDTYVPKPKITVVPSSESSASSRSSKKAASPVVLQTPADVIADFYAKREAKDEQGYRPPKLRLVNDSLQGEPDYLLPDNRFDPMALAWLLQNRVIDLKWREWGGVRTWGMNFNERTSSEAPTFYENMRNVYGQTPFDLLTYLESDSYFVPLEWIHPSLQDVQAFSQQDIDVASMFSFLDTGLWSVNQESCDAYTVHLDDRLWRGIPDATGLIARLLWMLRAFADYRGPFDVAFEPMHDATLDEVLPAFEGSCYGAPDKPEGITLNVADKPVPKLNGGMPRHPFDGGYSRYRNGGALHQEGYEAYLHDQELFEQRLRGQIDGFPYKATVGGGLYGTERTMERMRVLPGEVLTLVSEWACANKTIDGEDVVGIKAFDSEGNKVGVLMASKEIHELGPSDFGWRELACMLPYVTCVVRSVDKKDENVPVAVELSYDARGLSVEDIVHEALALMREPYEQRMRLSRGPHVASDLLLSHDDEGNPMGTLRVADELNPASAGVGEPQGSRPQLCENVLALVGSEDEMAALMGYMRKSVLRPRDEFVGWYHSKDELEQAETAEETFEVLRSDFAERLPYVFRQNPSASYYREKHLLRLDRVGDRLLLRMWFNTFDKTNNDDLASFFKGLPAAKMAVARVYKRADKREAHVLVDTFAKGKNSFGQMRRKDKVASLEQLTRRYEELDRLGTAALTDLQLAEWGMLDEALCNMAHKVFDARHAQVDVQDGMGHPRRASRYVAANGKVDAFAVTHLLAEDVVFATPEDVAWRMGKHVLKGLRVNRAAALPEMGFVRHAQDYLEGIADLLQTLEDDEALRVRRDDVHHSLCTALGEGDLTGMSLMLMMGWGRAIWLVDERDGELRESLALRAGVNLAKLDAQARASVYVLACDDRILRAVPKAYLLLRRLVGELRAYNGIEGPHVEVIIATHGDDAGAYLQDFKGKVSYAACDPVHVEGKLSQLMGSSSDERDADDGDATPAER